MDWRFRSRETTPGHPESEEVSVIGVVGEDPPVVDPSQQLRSGGQVRFGEGANRFAGYIFLHEPDDMLVVFGHGCFAMQYGWLHDDETVQRSMAV